RGCCLWQHETECRQRMTVYLAMDLLHRAQPLENCVIDVLRTREVNEDGRARAQTARFGDLRGENLPGLLRQAARDEQLDGAAANVGANENGDSMGHSSSLCSHRRDGLGLDLRVRLPLADALGNLEWPS